MGNTAATRPRVNLFGYDSDGDTWTDSAFVVVQLEEDKGLGRALYVEDENGLADVSQVCTPEQDEQKLCVAWDEGKNQWYHTFSMSLTDPMATHETDGLVKNLTFHGHMLNQPETNWTTGAFFPVLNTSEVWDFGAYNFDLHNTEIARRGSLLAQGIETARNSVNNLLVLPTWKQGQMNQGGPADVMSRRIVIPEGWSPADGNPYAFRNMQCDGDMLYTDGSNPYYPGGLCLAPAINMSSTIPDTAIDSQTGAAKDPPVVIGETNPILQGLVQGEGDTTKILTWHQEEANFADQSWYNPYEVAKGHRGFLDGDFVMMLYAWSPNWRLNTVGHDRYELYIRRSFSGAQSWTTLPASFSASDGETYNGDGTVTCETYRTADQQQQGDSTEPRVCTPYAAGAFEQARNVTQHASMRTTTLDPRYAKTAATIVTDFGFGIPNYVSGAGDGEDVRDPSRYFIVYETGDNTTTAEGEPEPLDLFYSRGVDFGDDYQVWAEDDLNIGDCYPSDPHGDDKVTEELVASGFCNEFDQLEQGTPGLEASEASLAANPGGEFMYAAWAQVQADTGDLQARADEAQALADEAQALADEAQVEADEAQALADEAQALADEAQVKADRAQVKADSAQALTDKVQALADRTQDRADRVQAWADAVGTDWAQALADRFQALADRTQDRADWFQDRADRVQALADDARTEADQALAEAVAAQALADEAQARADQALAEAVAAQALADEAQALADEAAGDVGESDAMVRRTWWIDGYISDTFAWDFGQGSGGGE